MLQYCAAADIGGVIHCGDVMDVLFMKKIDDTVFVTTCTVFVQDFLNKKE